MGTWVFSLIIDTFGGDYHDREHWAVMDWERTGVVVGCDYVVFL